MMKMHLQRKVLLASWVHPRNQSESRNKNPLLKINVWVNKEDKNRTLKMKPMKKIKNLTILWRRNILRFQSMRSTLKLNKIPAHQNSHVQNLQWREWKLSSKKLSKKTKRTLKIPIKKLTNKTLKLLMMMKSFHQNHPWARLPACKLNLHKRSNLVSAHQKVFLLKLLSYLKMKIELILPIFSMLIPMLSIMGNLFAEKF